MTTHKQPTNETAITAACQQRIKALQAFPPSGAGVSINGTVYTGPQLAAIYQKCLDARAQLVSLRNQEEAALAARKLADADRKKVDKALLIWAAATFGQESPEAKAYGYVAPQPTPPNTAVKAQAAAQAQETKKARGIVGKKQRQAIKAPAAQPAAAATTAAPAAPAPGATTPKS
jgi:hypothetical protein